MTSLFTSPETKSKEGDGEDEEAYMAHLSQPALAFSPNSSEHVHYSIITTSETMFVTIIDKCGWNSTFPGQLP